MKDPTLLDYYTRRAEEYEQIYQKPERLVELSLLKAYLIKLLAGRDVLEVACGTGYWTAHLAPFTRSILATDDAGEVLDVARAKAYPPRRVRVEQADAYALDTITGAFSAGFAGFWWSHVPQAWLPGFLSTFHGKLQSGARVVFLWIITLDKKNTPFARKIALFCIM